MLSWPYCWYKPTVLTLKLQGERIKLTQAHKREHVHTHPHTISLPHHVLSPVVAGVCLHKSCKYKAVHYTPAAPGAHHGQASQTGCTSNHWQLKICVTSASAAAALHTMRNPNKIIEVISTQGELLQLCCCIPQVPSLGRLCTKKPEPFHKALYVLGRQLLSPKPHNIHKRVQPGLRGCRP